MKQGTNSVLAVEIGCDLDEVTSIQFKLQQTPDRFVKFTYPSTSAYRESSDTNVVELLFSPSQTYLFNPDNDIRLDTIITMKDSSINPDTEMVTLKMLPTLFTKSELSS